jgi:hypothetical protein
MRLVEDIVYCMPKVSMVVSLAELLGRTSSLLRVADDKWETFEPDSSVGHSSRVVVLL